MPTFGPTILLHRGDDFVHTLLPPLGDLTAVTDSWFTVKADHTDTDDEAKILIQESVGLTRINGEAATVAGNGSITITAPTRGTVVVTLAAVEVAKLTSSSGKWFYDYQVTRPAGITTLLDGELVLVGDITRATT